MSEARRSTPADHPDLEPGAHGGLPAAEPGTPALRAAGLSVRDARRAADEAQACYHELQRRNDTMIERRREAIDRGDLMQSHRLAPEHRRIILQLHEAAHAWNLAVAQLLDAELNERGY